MALIVQKFGGTSVATTERIKNVATLVAREVDKGNQVVVVVSAMSGVTNQLVSYVRDLSPMVEMGDLEEYDVVVSSGEQVTTGLLSIALRNNGYPAHSMQGWQAPILTDKAFSKARVSDIKCDAIRKRLNAGEARFS